MKENSKMVVLSAIHNLLYLKHESRPLTESVHSNKIIRQGVNSRKMVANYRSYIAQITNLILK